MDRVGYFRHDFMANSSCPFSTAAAIPSSLIALPFVIFFNAASISSFIMTGPSSFYMPQGSSLLSTNNYLISSFRLSFTWISSMATTPSFFLLRYTDSSFAGEFSYFPLHLLLVNPIQLLSLSASLIHPFFFCFRIFSMYFLLSFLYFSTSLSLCVLLSFNYAWILVLSFFDWYYFFSSLFNRFLKCYPLPSCGPFFSFVLLF